MQYLIRKPAITVLKSICKQGREYHAEQCDNNGLLEVCELGMEFGIRIIPCKECC